ncbi:hypothetical protein AOQ71_11090 [Bradyrhizobium manausense]|uniref:Uncharacterized protein n=1 Tax=Bradyrhizobium manausense TaxID=989370 RepID=A0A0R3DYC4_9BRAD|nr:hypothetical protein AOQ71_11090 [Bradyrhizobium manausense]
MDRESAARQHHKPAKTFGLARFQLKYSAGPLPHEKLMKSIALYARKVMPMLREMMGWRKVRLRLRSPETLLRERVARTRLLSRSDAKASEGILLRAVEGCKSCEAR